jgi:hypothetical protein
MGLRLQVIALPAPCAALKLKLKLKAKREPAAERLRQLIADGLLR